MLMVFSALMAVAAANPQAVKPAENDPVVCTRPADSDAHSVGTRMRPRKICKRKSEWQALNEGTQSEANRDKRTEKPAPVAGGGRQ